MTRGHFISNEKEAILFPLQIGSLPVFWIPRSSLISLPFVPSPPPDHLPRIVSHSPLATRPPPSPWARIQSAPAPLRGPFFSLSLSPNDICCLELGTCSITAASQSASSGRSSEKEEKEIHCSAGSQESVLNRPKSPGATQRRMH